MNTIQATRLVADREIRVKLRDRTFLFSTLFFLLIAAAAHHPAAAALRRPVHAWR